MKLSVTFMAVLVILGSALGFQMTPQGALVAARSRLQQQRRVVSSSAARTSSGRRARQQTWVSMQLGPIGEKERGTMPTYDQEQEQEFFSSNLDNASTEEKLKDPVALVALGWIVGMFGITTILILNGGF